MSEERRARAREILQSALAKKPDERSRFLREACQSDPTLIPEVENLLDSYERVSQRLGKRDRASGSAPSGASLDASGQREPTQIGKYEVLERVGQGAMGVVYKARDPLMRRLVGIKTISSDIASDQDLHDRFYREAQSAGTLSHKNIITIYELGEQGGQPFIAMEFLAGEDLKSKLDRRAKLTLEQRLQWMIEMCDGLQHAHEKEVIHRDIKPGNVFVTREGEIKILDFGLARLTSSVATKTGSVMGTPSYMSPEQVRGEKVDHRSDLFSLGATFYELLAFKKPFTGESIHGVFFQILEKMPPHLSQLNPWIPKELESIVTRAITKDVEARYGAASEISAELRRLEAGLPERKPRLRVEAIGLLGEVEPLLVKYRTHLEREGIPVVEAQEETLVLPPALLNLDPSEAPTVGEEIPTDFIGLATVISRALEQKQRLTTEIAKLDTARRRLEEAAALEEKRDPTAALARADAVLRELPEHPRAIAFVDRLSVDWGARNASWKQERIERLLADAKERLQAKELAACQERIERARVLGADDPRVGALSERIERNLEEQRRQRDHAKRADALVREARAKLTKERDPRACLTILSEALSLQPDHSAGRELWERAQEQLDQQLAAAAAETAAAAVASATQAMRHGDLTRAASELARAEREFPEHTEIPAIATQLVKAKQSQIETLLERSRASLERDDFDGCLDEVTELLKLDPTHREATALLRDARKGRARRAPSPSAAVPARAPIPMWMTTLGTIAALAIAGVIGWRVLQTEELTPPPIDEPSTSSVIPVASTSAAPSSTATPTTSAAPVTSVSPTSVTTSVPVTSAVTSRPTTSVATSVATTSSVPVETTSVPPTSVAPVLTPREQILALMQQYETAYETLDVDLLGALYPSVPLAVKNSFQNFESLTLEMEALSGPSIDRATAGRTATAVYRIVQTIEPKVGKSTTSRHQATFQFAGVGNAWIIVSVQWQAE